MARYHHGNLRESVLAEAAETIGREGPGQLNLRSVAKALGVSHTAPLHHFGSREGVMNALATQGYTLLAERLEAAAGRSFEEVGVAYVEFAVSHPGHFSVMFAPDLVDWHEPGLAAARARTFAVLQAGAEDQAGSVQAAGAATAAWSLVHGLAILILSGSLAASGLRAALGEPGVLDLARATTAHLFPSAPDQEVRA